MGCCNCDQRSVEFGIKKIKNTKESGDPQIVVCLKKMVERGYS